MGYGSKSIRDYQDEVEKWSKKNFQPQDPIDPLLGITEEVGELNHAILKHRQGIRKGVDAATSQAMIKDALGDIFVFMCDFCQRNNIDLEDCVRDTWQEVLERDWQKNKKDGVTA